MLSVPSSLALHVTEKPRTAMQPLTEPSPDAHLHRWYSSSACRGHYNSSAALYAPPIDAESRLRLQLVRTLEDKCSSGRREVRPFHAAQEVVLSNTWKIGYVPIRKAGSSAIPLVMRALSGEGDWSICHDGKPAEGRQCTDPSAGAFPPSWAGRCNTLCRERSDASNIDHLTGPGSQPHVPLAQSTT